ncbi:helix-turn-helix domain-containing protein [Bifidobacterium sp.]|uniref:helix-turn-helix domain-containing protein n=1 Tax=Bifidobacterium sp. TaxID=41200 RepID=UPI003867299A
MGVTMSIGRRITAMRGYRVMTQEELGELVGVAKQTVSNWENDRRVPRANELKALCRALECSSDYLLELVDEPSDHVRW